MTRADEIYAQLPASLQHFACSLHGWRVRRRIFGGRFYDYLREVEDRTFWSGEAMRAFRDARVRHVVRECARTVPFYRSRFREAGISPDDIGGAEDLAYLPTVSKADVQERYGAFLSESVRPADVLLRHTGGTTGAGLKLASTLEAVRIQEAYYWRFRRWHGIQPDTWCAYFGGRQTVPSSQRRPPFWRVNYTGRQIYFSPYHLRTETLGLYVRALARFRPPWIHGYPSALSLLAGHALEAGVHLGYTPRWITTGAETLLPDQRAVIERAFGTAPRNRYVMTEAVAAASECERGSLHLDDDFAAIELVPTAGAYRILGTNLINPAMPLLRYETNDFALPAEAPCGCGRPGRTLAALDGRIEDHVLLPNGTRLVRLHRIFRKLVNVREAQIRQRRVGEITVRVVRGPLYTAADEAALLGEVRARVGGETRIDLEYVTELERSRSGKVRFVVSEVPEGRLLTGTGVRDQAVGESHPDSICSPADALR